MKKNKGRDFNAIAAQFRNSAGPEKVKRKHDDKFACREFKKKWRDSILEIEEETEEEKGELYDNYTMGLLALDEELDN